jgi:iron complex outermembrane recepter protein
MKKVLAMILTVLTTVIAGFAQSKTGKISGTVIDGNTKTIESATITLHRVKDSSVAKISVADKTGHYNFDNIGEGSYFVSISAVGHTKGLSETFTIDATHQSVALKTIELVPVAKSVGGVTVTARKPLVEQKIDRMIVNVDASPSNVGASALEVLEKSPGLSVDKDGNISLKGKQGVIVLIDGRETQMGATDLANYLRSINASQLETIEIMTNPPARFDASGTAGVVNIKTKKTKQLGYNGSANASYGQGRYPKINEGLTMNYRKNKANFFTNLNHNYSKNFGELTLNRVFRDKNTSDVLSYFDQVARMRNEQNNYNARIGMDYFANARTSFGISLNGYWSNRDNTNRNITDILDGAHALKNQTRAISTGKQTWKNFSSNLNFRRTLDSAGSELTADVDIVKYDSRNNNDMVNGYFNISGNPIEKPDTLLGNLPQEINIYSGRVDYLKNIAKDVRFEAGIKVSYVKTDNNAIYDSVQYGQIVRDFNRSNYFIYEENINAAYANFSTPLGKKWSAQAGLRMENTNAKGNQVTTGEKFDRHYTQLFPTLYLQYKSDEKNSFVLNYGKRIRRPDYQRLNPFINFLDRYTFQQGNPNLKPQFSHNIELSHGYKGLVTTTLNYTRTTDIIQQVFEQNEATNETFVKPANIAKQQQFGLSVNTTIPVTKWWRSNVFANVFTNKYEGIITNELVTVSATTFSINGTQVFNFAKTWSAEIGGWWRTGGIEGVMEAKAMGALNIGFGKEIFKKKASLRVNLRDVFWSQGFSAISKYNNIDIKLREVRDSRVLTVGFTYRFSKGKMNNVKKRNGSASSEEQNRIGQ